MVSHSSISRSPSKLTNLHLDMITPSRVQSSKPPIISVKFPLWFSIIIILLFHTTFSFSTSSLPEQQAKLWSRARLRAREVDTTQKIPTQDEGKALKCLTSTCKSTKNSHVVAVDTQIHHHAKISTTSKSSKNPRPRDCTPQASDNTTPKNSKESTEKTQAKQSVQRKKKSVQVEPKVPKDNSKEPFPNQKNENGFLGPRTIDFNRFHDMFRSYLNGVGVTVPQPPPIESNPPYTKSQPTSGSPDQGPSKTSTDDPSKTSSKTNSKKLSDPSKNPSKSSSKKKTSKVNSNKPNDSDSASSWLAAHNNIRKKYSAPDLVWSSELEASAQAWANTCLFEHSYGPTGENIAAGQQTIESVVDDWVYSPDECQAYQPVNPIYSHFTQVLWASTSKLGCARQHCKNVRDTPLTEAFYWVCQYDPPGNVQGEFGANVHAEAGQCLK